MRRDVGVVGRVLHWGVTQTGRMSRQTEGPPGLLAPLRGSATFRALWIGQLAMQVGIWIETVAAQWSMVDAGASTLVVAMVQAAVTLPFLVLAIPGGVIADLVQRRWLLVGVNGGAALVAVLLTAASLSGWLHPAMLLMLTALLGVAVAVSQPGVTAAVPDVVPAAHIAPASMLASISVNLARVIGPAIGGLLIASMGATAAYAASALGFALFAVLLVAARDVGHVPQPQSFLPAMRSGLDHVVSARPFRLLLVITGWWFVAGSVLWALLPVVALREFGLGPGEYGWILATAGMGAVGGTVIFAPLRTRVETTRYVLWLIPLFGLALVVVAEVHVTGAVIAALLLAGFTWTTMGAIVMASAQMLLPAWVRARGIAYYYVASQGGLALGSLLWGVVGGRTTATGAFLVAAACLVPLWLFVLVRRMPTQAG